MCYNCSEDNNLCSISPEMIKKYQIKRNEASISEGPLRALPVEDCLKVPLPGSKHFCWLTAPVPGENLPRKKETTPWTIPSAIPASSADTTPSTSPLDVPDRGSRWAGWWPTSQQSIPPGRNWQCPEQHTMLAPDKDAESPLRASMQKDAQLTKQQKLWPH